MRRSWRSRWTDPRVNDGPKPALTTYCAAKGITESAAVQTAVEDHLDGEAKDNDLILRRLDRLGRESLGHQRDLAVLTESFSVFARMCFLYFPPMVETEKAVAGTLRAGAGDGWAATHAPV